MPKIIKKTDKSIVIPAPDLRSMKVKIHCSNNIIFNKWTEKAKMEIREKQQKKASTMTRQPRNPELEYQKSFYRNIKGEIAIPALNLKQAIVSTARVLPSVAMTQLRACIFVLGDSDGLIEIRHKGKTLKPAEEVIRTPEGYMGEKFYGERIYAVDKKLPEVIQMREDMVRLAGGGSADLRYRGQVKDWSVEFVIKWLNSMFSAEQVLNLVQYSGFSSGIGEWRPEKSGDFGTFEIEA